jgi:hypothetical protein
MLTAALTAALAVSVVATASWAAPPTAPSMHRPQAPVVSARLQPSGYGTLRFLPGSVTTMTQSMAGVGYSFVVAGTADLYVGANTLNESGLPPPVRRAGYQFALTFDPSAPATNAPFRHSMNDCAQMANALAANPQSPRALEIAFILSVPPNAKPPRWDASDGISEYTTFFLTCSLK